MGVHGRIESHGVTVNSKGMMRETEDILKESPS
jgi:hypothetical protein